MSAPRKVTIREVALAAGVSPATVSLVYNDKGEVAQATRERVLREGERLGYKPGWISKVFRSGRTNIIGVAVLHGDTPIWERTYLPYYHGIIAGAAMEGLEHGYTVTALKVEADGSFVDRLSLDGIIVVDPQPGDPTVAQALAEGIAVIAEGGYLGTPPPGRLRTVRTDIVTGLPLALDELKRRGAGRPAFFRGCSRDLYTDLSEQVYQEWCAAHGHTPVQYVLGEGESPIHGARVLLNGAGESFDSLYCVNGTYSRAALAAASELRITVPDELAIAVASEELDAAVDPRLISLALDPLESGRQCVRTLVQMLEGRDAEDVLLPMSLRG
ncbi:LacI family DNA-binding transcriptional regulator [Leucobacter sp. VD1]|uniref:LacI family DNA-binding transcriptional regulator n=1 Tax=Leucobacter sp. VD1 TaxID=3080381 RepID=UPI0030173426